MTCQTYSRAYLRHLAVTKELSLHRLLSIHNLTMTENLVADARTAIEQGSFDQFHRRVVERRLLGQASS